MASAPSGTTMESPAFAKVRQQIAFLKPAPTNFMHAWCTSPDTQLIAAEAPSFGSARIVIRFPVQAEYLNVAGILYVY